VAVPKVKDTAARFIANARASAAVVTEARSLDEALDYALDLCLRKPPRENLPCGGTSSPRLEEEARLLAAPGLDAASAALLEQKGKERGVRILRAGLRAWPAGIDLGLVLAEGGIAESATCLVDTTDEDVRLATMICEISVLVLPKSSLAETPREFAASLTQRLNREAACLTWISGPSKTSDIERVLAIGVHGPLELHIALVSQP
jgi:L-lactate dehydrogenase complex protein LldG